MRIPSFGGGRRCQKLSGGVLCFFEDTEEFGGGVREASAAAEDEINVARQIEAADLHFLHPAVLDFPGDAHAGNDGDAHAHLDEAFDAFDGRHFDGHVQGGAIAREKFNDAAAEGGFHDVGDKILLAEFGDFHFAALGEGMFGRNDKSELILEDFRSLKLRFARNKRNGAKIQTIVQDFVGNIAGKKAMNANLHARMQFAELGESGKQSVDGAFVDAKREFAALEAFEFAQAFLHFVAEIDEALGVFAQEGAGVGKADRPRATNEKGLAKIVLQLADGQADSGLSAIKALARAGEAAFAGHGKKNLKFA
jgi:hypothetical protein